MLTMAHYEMFPFVSSYYLCVVLCILLGVTFYYPTVLHTEDHLLVFRRSYTRVNHCHLNVSRNVYFQKPPFFLMADGRKQQKIWVHLLWLSNVMLANTGKKNNKQTRD